ncbi:gliding motility-associated C-terminal domain-containing protein [Mucilaginibacter sp. 21P]|uniref:gliding motility-associated C-terminal domain-containing protein n=1 Tax=Mucilaginibacter sp. 21P TaxID=2778902 RepID=UPI001C594D04|nr:gliding motility-associated C-terminal domain-containing protein [Mucilaginibacter sp. 21P]QXV66666.1 gliding motility-associated C-terminal domain-containing protein [Mucilaginibacter sp. 21P]
MITFLAIIFFVAPAFAGKVRMVFSHGLNDSTGNILRQLKPFANCYDVNWATWPAQNNVTSLTGSVIDADGTPIDINMVANYTFGTTPSIYSFNSRLSGYPSTIPNSTVPKTEWAAGPGGTTTMCFSRKVTNPVLLLASLGSSLPQSASLTFSTPYVVLYDGGGMVYDSNTKITGTEGYAIIMFPGDFTCVTIDSNTPEYYTNLTWGIRPQPFNINIAEGAATCGSTKLTASGGVSYEWSGGDTPNQPTNTFHTSGTYTVTVTNASGCVTSASKAVTVYDGVSLITGFTLPQQIAPPVINNTDKTVEITVADGTDLTALTPQITTTPVTNTVPAANTTRDFTGRVYYKLVNPCSDVTYAVDVKVQNIVTPINVCPGNTVTMAGANVTLPVTSYAWQIQQGTVWEPASGITNSADYNTNSSSNLSGVDVIRNYRRAVTKSGFTTYDSYYKVVISPTTAQNEISVDQPVACGNTARTFFFLGNVPSGYFGYSAYQWQTSTDGITWHNEANAFLQNWTISLTLTKKLMIRRITKTGNCEAYSNVITLDYIPGPTPATVGPPVTLCNVSTYTLTGNTPGLGETGTWSVTSTTGYNPFNASNIHDPNAVITGMPLNAEFDFTWTISKSTCDQTSSASVLITNGISSKITGFAVTGQNGPAVIDQTNHTITISVSPQTNLTGLSPNIIINSGTLSPASGVARNFTSPVTYSLSNACSIIYYNVVITQSVPEELNVCNDAFNILLVGNETSGAIYQWEKYTNGTWQSVGSQGANSDYIAPISNTFPAIVVENYRRKTTVGGTINYQPYINLNIYPQINNNSISTTTNTICATGDKDVTITGSTPAGGNGTFTYQWRVSTDNNSWQIVNGATEKDFQFTFISPVRQYYSRVAISGDCRVISNSVKIDYVGYVTLTSVSIAPVSCGQTKVTLIATPPNSNETGTWSLTGPAGYNPFNSTNMHNPEVTLINVPVDVDIKFSWSIVQTVCGASSQGSNSVHISSKPIVSAGNEVVIEIGEKATLNGSVSPNTTYVWSPAAGLSNTTTLNPVAAPLNTTTYTLTATNAAGCPAWATVKVTVNNELKIPNSITPNGDGVNDTWVIKNLENYPKANVQIFTRAGILVYSARGASKNWDATYNGKKLPAAVYYYVISMEDNKAKKSGWITVIY